MKRFLKELFTIEKHPTRGLMAFEWVILIYLVGTLLVTLAFWNQAANPSLMVWRRMGVLAVMAVLWGVYRLVPCKALKVLRVLAHMALLSRWYPDTYELNRMLPNLDHLFADAEQWLFGCQPALLFSQMFDNKVFSELMCLGYSSYYPIIAAVAVYYLMRRPQEFERVIFVIVGTFFAHYVIFDLLPVAGPQYYYKAVGEDLIGQGVFPNLHGYFFDNQECLPIPGWEGGPFHQLVVHAHNAGERPTAAFPSSHVSVTLVLLLLAWHSRSRRLFFCLLPLGVLMFFGTFYIKAHYAIDALAGLVSGTLCYWVLMRYKGGRWSVSYASGTPKRKKKKRR
ncbi:MAG: phosphatase PAP2 family protein [Prevotella sp.]|nr:phosphatase PAP2 family protein [Prevotella sp.]